MIYTRKITPYGGNSAEKNTPYGGKFAGKNTPYGGISRAGDVFSSKKIPPMRHFSSKKIPPMELNFEMKIHHFGGFSSQN